MSTEKIKEKIVLEKDDKTPKLDRMMKAIKAVRSHGGTADPTSTESLEKQRHNQETLSKIITPSANVRYERKTIKDIPVEWAIPKFPYRKDRIILYCHGGGYTCGGLGYAGILAGKLALNTGLQVLSFEYRLAPENPYPAAVTDAFTIWDELMLKGYGAGEIILAGDSAGGNLALELTLGLKNLKRMLPRGLILMSPWTDMTLVSETYEEYKELDPMLTYEYVEGVRNAYAGENADFKSPKYSPLFADLKHMPPTYIQVGTNEILRGDSEKLYIRLKESGVRARLDVYEGGWHVFQQMPTPRAAGAMEDIGRFTESII